MSKFVIVAPFWRQPAHVGNYRVDRFIRWLSERGDEVVVIRGGERDHEDATPWGIEVTVRDPLGFYPERRPSSDAPARRPNRLRRAAAVWIFNPDPSIIWAHLAVKNATVLRHSEGARWVVSSSPPESPHVAAAQLARNLKADLLIDMRDGWLDEPLKPLLHTSALRRWREGRLESRILRQARCILVTSDIWREMLEARLPFTRGKTVVLRNAYPQAIDRPVSTKSTNNPLRLLHAGRLRGSSQSRCAALLLDPLEAAISSNGPATGTLTFLGQLSREDQSELSVYENRFEKRGWQLEIQSVVPREQMLSELFAASGLLLLSASQAAIPSKTFEYISTGKPVLAACPEGSAVWRMASELPQFFPVDYNNPERAAATARAFLNRCQAGGGSFEIPDRYSERYLKEVFLGQVSG